LLKDVQSNLYSMVTPRTKGKWSHKKSDHLYRIDWSGLLAPLHNYSGIAITGRYWIGKNGSRFIKLKWFVFLTFYS
jgi:hypothetical protein